MLADFLKDSTIKTIPQKKIPFIGQHTVFGKIGGIVSENYSTY